MLCCICSVLGHLAPVHRCASSVCCAACAVAWPLGSCSPVFTLGVLCCVCGVLGHLAPVHRSARLACCVAFAVSWATWLLFTGVHARCVVLCVWCPGPLAPCSPVCWVGVLRCMCGALGHLAPVHRCVRSECCAACAVSWATWLLFTGVYARCVVLRVRCPQPLSWCSPVSSLGALTCVCGVLDHSAPVHRCACSACCVACAVSWATGPLFTGVRSSCVVFRVQCPGPLGPCSPVCSLGVCVACAVSLATWLLVTGVQARHVVLRVPCPGPLGFCSPCACSVRCVACAVSWATWLLFTGVHARRAVLRVRCPGPLGSCSAVCWLSMLCCVCGVQGHLAPVHRCARPVRCVACALSSATWFLFTGIHARRVVLRVWCPGPRGPVHRCALSVCCVPCAVSWATWLLFGGVFAWCTELRVWCPGPLCFCAPVSTLGMLCCVCHVLPTWLLFTLCLLCALCCVCGVLGLLAPVHRSSGSASCVACAVSWATWFLFTDVHAWYVVLCVRCPGPLGSYSLVFSLDALPWVCGVLGHSAPVHRCACLVRCVPCAVSWATWFLFTGVLARCFKLFVRCPRPLGSCSPVFTLGVLCCVCGVLGHLAPVYHCARLACCVACVVFWATWLLFTGVHAWRVVLRVRCPGPHGSCSSLCTLGALSCVCGVLGHLAPVHRCTHSVCCVVCAVSWAT